jgi:drug/metabolite transporter (DMT)-like permease
MATTPNKRKEILTLAIVFAGVLLISAFAVYVIGGRGTPSTTTTGQVEEPTAQGRQPVERPSPTAGAGSGTFIDELFGNRNSDVLVTGERWAATIGRISLRLLLAALLGAALAYRPRKRILALKRNPYVSQTQILLAIVAAALMIIVGDNAARAF